MINEKKLKYEINVLSSPSCLSAWLRHSGVIFVHVIFVCNGTTLAHFFFTLFDNKTSKFDILRLLLSTVMLLMKDLVSLARPEGSEQ